MFMCFVLQAATTEARLSNTGVEQLIE